MKLNKLIIFVDDNKIREIKFHDGLNLVLNKRGVGRSGNSVGKTTLARVLDYLFLGSIKPIYIDEEFNRPNEKIEELFIKHQVRGQLDFLDLGNNPHSISRNFSISPENSYFLFDGENVSESEYEKQIKEKFLNIQTQRPSVRFVAPKFFRNDSHRMLNTTKFLDQHTSENDYSELFLYLFGFENTSLLTDKRKAANLESKMKKRSTTINAIIKEQKPNLEIKKVKTAAEALEKSFLSFNYTTSHETPLARLSELQYQEDRAIEKSLRISQKIDNITRTIALLNQQGGNYLVNEARAIYEFAGASIDGAIREYEKVLSFHDKLVSRKKQFLDSDLPELLEMKEFQEKKLYQIRQEKIDVFTDMRSDESIKKITENLKLLGELKINLGRLEGLLEQQKIATANLDDAREKLQEIITKISLELSLVNQFEKVFNKHFKRLTNLIHDDPYEFKIIFDEKNGMCGISVNNKTSNPEGGKKKAEVIAFDLAYISAVAELKKKRPTFVFHDSIEDIDQNQINTIFMESKNLPGQQIISMLSDKLTEDMYVKYLPHAILLLSEDDMFFKI